MLFQDIISLLKSATRPRSQEPEFHEDEDPKHSPALATTEEALREPETITPTHVTGLRKGSPSNRRPITRRSWSRSVVVDVEPSDYLYFGEGISATDVSQSLSSRSRSKSTSNTSSLSPSRTRNNATSQSGQDHSGFLNAQINTHTTQMGYSNLTYGGSLQYDYAETQGRVIGGAAFG
ncbi:hypothetical protein GGS26DRAFT_596980 [Hypomontagnella submonticulosa]|nr:hypothetical protein GGS26DRAFT_596980 [Hypomontagnella submonticulosa]